MPCTVTVSCVCCVTHHTTAVCPLWAVLVGLVQNVKFYKGIMYAVRRVQEMRIKPHVLDIGAGTGLLSLMAVKCGAEEVTACEVRCCVR